MLPRLQQRIRNWELDRKVVRVPAKDVDVAYVAVQHKLFSLQIFLVLTVFRELVLRA
jgi:hypothetical protein